MRNWKIPQWYQYSDQGLSQIELEVVKPIQQNDSNSDRIDSLITRSIFDTPIFNGHLRMKAAAIIWNHEWMMNEWRCRRDDNSMKIKWNEPHLWKGRGDVESEARSCQKPVVYFGWSASILPWWDKSAYSECWAVPRSASTAWPVTRRRTMRTKTPVHRETKAHRRALKRHRPSAAAALARAGAPSAKWRRYQTEHPITSWGFPASVASSCTRHRHQPNSSWPS